MKPVKKIIWTQVEQSIWNSGYNNVSVTAFNGIYFPVNRVILDSTLSQLFNKLDKTPCSKIKFRFFLNTQKEFTNIINTQKIIE